MKALVIAECLLLLAGVAGCGYRENPLWDDKPTQSPPAVPEMNALIRNIHAGLLKLREKHPWLSEYGDKFLYAGEGRSSIYYYPRWSQDGEDVLAQQPDHLLIIYLPIDTPKKGKYSNDFEDQDACRFPELGCKLYGQLLCRSKEHEAVAKAVREIVLANCRKAREALEARGPAR